jgi:hypothetical protein
MQPKAQTECESCVKRAAAAPSGSYSMACLQCCTDLILATHPLKAQAAAMLRVIQKHPQNPGREQVLESVRLALAKRPSASPKSHLRLVKG